MPRTGGTGDGIVNAALRLRMIAKMNPQVWEIIDPKGPQYSPGAIHAIAAQMIKTISASIENKEVKTVLEKHAPVIFQKGAAGMRFELDDWCVWGNHHHHFTAEGNFIFDGSEAGLNPQPLPPGDKFYGAVLIILSEVIDDKEIAAHIANAGNTLIR